MLNRKTVSFLMTMLFIVVQAGIVVGSLHVGSQLFANGMDNVPQPTEQPRWSIGGYLQSFWDILVNTVVDVIKQAINYIHQTIVLAIILWVFRRLKNRWTILAPTVYGAIDRYMDKTSIDNRAAIKKYLNEIIIMSIDAVEAAFVLHKAPLTSDQEEEAAYRAQRSKDKAAAALYLVFKEITMDKLDRIVGKEKTVEELAGDILKEIEAKVLEKQDEAEQKTGTDAIWTIAVMAQQDAKSMKKLQRFTDVAKKHIKEAQQKLPANYLECINKVVNANF